jgi:ABC-2 type transport system permease protein
MLTVELATLARRPRTWLLIALVLLLPTAFLAGMAGAPDTAPKTQDPVAFLAASRHGWSLTWAPLLFGSPVFLPVAVAVIAGTALGTDAASGHLRYLLVRPVTRTRVYLAKQATAVVFCLAATTALLLLGTAAALLLPHHGDPRPEAVNAAGVTTPLGDGAYVSRLLAAGGYIALWLSSFAAIGVLAGLLTRSAVGGVGIALGYHLVAGVLTQVSALHGIRPALLPYWLGRWTTLGQTKPDWATLTQGATCAAAYLIVCTLAGTAVVKGRDITD